MLHAITSDHIRVAPDGLHATAMVRTIQVEAILDPDVATTTIGTALAKRLPGMPPVAARVAGAAPARVGTTVKLRHVAHPIATAIFTEDLPAGVKIRIGRDVLTQEALRLDFGAGRIAAVSAVQAARLSLCYLPIRLTLADDGDVLNWGGKPIRFRSAAGNAASGETRTVDDHGVTLAVHDDGVGSGEWIGWEAFAGRRVVLDLPHGTIWLAYPRAALDASSCRDT